MKSENYETYEESVVNDDEIDDNGFEDDENEEYMVSSNQYEENGLKRIPPSAKFAEQNKIK